MPPPPQDQASPDYQDWLASVEDYKSGAAATRACCRLKDASGYSILGYGKTNEPTNHTLTDAQKQALAAKGCSISGHSEVVER
jgi:hypothetical protein